MRNLKLLLNPFMYIAIGYIIIFNLYMPEPKSARIFSIICGILLYLVGTYLLFRTKVTTKMSPEVYQHYKKCGLTDRDIQFFRERLIYLDQKLMKLKHKGDQLSQLIGEQKKEELFQVLNGIYEELVLMPKKLIMIDDFLYQYLPNCIEGIDEQNKDKLNQQIKQMIQLYKKMNQDDFEEIELEYLHQH